MDDQSSQLRNPPPAPTNVATPRSAAPSPSITLLVWLLLQIGALMLAALRVPLWAHAPAGGEFLALEILGATQILAGALLFPVLLSDWRSSAMAIGVAWPMLLLAGFLANSPIGTMLLAGGYVSAWLLVLAIWRLPLSSTKPQLTASAVAAGWAAAGPVLIYAHAEFPLSPLPPLSPTICAATGPITGLFTLLSPDSSHQIVPWVALALPFTIAAAWIMARKLGRRRNPHQ
ncbi:MAG TPA: hypothetical protein VG269_12760 [Tepidisphaeraceae bacterium]|nr:hypothetical protein [Tepidisphaeraceae bacterium]